LAGVITPERIKYREAQAAQKARAEVFVPFVFCMQ
jgi:hypothetical protein